MKKTMPDMFVSALNEWFGRDKYKMIHFWEESGTYLVTVRYGDTIHFVRLFRWIGLGANASPVQISVDAKYKIGGQK